MKLLLLVMLALSLALTANQASAWTQKDCDDWFKTHGTVHPDCVGKPTPTPTHTVKPTPSATPSPTATPTTRPTPTATLVPPSRPTYTPGPVCQETPPITVPCAPVVTQAPLPKRLPNTSTSSGLEVIVIGAIVLLVGIIVYLLATADPRASK